jgi:hypothetical protein
MLAYPRATESESFGPRMVAEATKLLVATARDLLFWCSPAALHMVVFSTGNFMELRRFHAHAGGAESAFLRPYPAC